MGILYSLPFAGRNRISSAYGSRTLNGKKEWHAGWDIVGLDSTDIGAACPGTVKSSTIITDRNDLTWQWGNYVKVRDALKNDLFACHMASRAVTVGQSVDTGDKLGPMGDTGYSFGAHTHWEARTAAGETIDPGELFGLPNMAGVTYDREAMEATVIGYLECLEANYRWRVGPGTDYALYKPAGTGACMHCRVGVVYRVYAVATVNGVLWCQITPPPACVAAGKALALWVSAACGGHLAKAAVPAAPAAPAVDWQSACNEFIVTVTGADRSALRALCERLALPVTNMTRT